MIFPDRLCIINASVYLWSIVLCNPDHSLDYEKAVCDETEDCVRGDEMGAAVRNLVVFDNDETGNEGENGGTIEDGVDIRAVSFLFGRVSRLKYEDCLGREKDAGRV